MKNIFLFIFILGSFYARCQERDTLSVLSYNLLNFPGVSPERIDTLEEILAYIKPDILMVCELTSSLGANSILYDALNEDGVSSYDMADYIAGPDTQNELYFNSDKLGLYEQNVIPTVLRDINEYVLYYKSVDIGTIIDTTFFYVYVCHLKASTGFQEQRNTEILALKAYLSSHPKVENIILGGDFNFYGSDTEPGWNTILTGEGVIMKDPLTLPGHWHEDAGFAWTHTQSTRTTSFDGGAYGGMDDRFDFIFIGEDLKNYSNNGLYVTGSYRAIGQDGLHFNKSLIESPTNVSEPTEIISALYHMSDHLPVYLEIEVVKEAASIKERSFVDLLAYCDVKNDEIRFRLLEELAQKDNLSGSIYDLHGQVVISIDSLSLDQTISISMLDAGSYVLYIEDYNYTFRFIKN